MANKIDNLKDNVLLISFLKGNKDAFSSIYNKYVDELFAYGISMGFERETLKDAIQDTFFKFYIHKKVLKGIQNLKYYLFSMLRNRLLDIYRSSTKESLLRSLELPFLLEESIIENIIREEERQSVEHQVSELMETLTNRQKEAVYLRFIEGLEYEEIGNLLDMTAPAVRKLVARAIKRMREEKK